MKKETKPYDESRAAYDVARLSFFRNFAVSDREVTTSRKCKRKTSFPFAFLSTFRNFGFAELTMHSEEKEKCFSLFFSRFFVTLYC